MQNFSRKDKFTFGKQKKNTHSQIPKSYNNVEFLQKISYHFLKTVKKSHIHKFQNPTIMQNFSTNYQNTFDKQKKNHAQSKSYKIQIWKIKIKF